MWHHRASCHSVLPSWTAQREHRQPARRVLVQGWGESRATGPPRVYLPEVRPASPPQLGPLSWFPVGSGGRGFLCSLIRLTLTPLPPEAHLHPALHSGRKPGSCKGLESSCPLAKGVFLPQSWPQARQGCEEGDHCPASAAPPSQPGQGPTGQGTRPSACTDGLTLTLGM